MVFAEAQERMSWSSRRGVEMELLRQERVGNCASKEWLGGGEWLWDPLGVRNLLNGLADVAYLP